MREPVDADSANLPTASTGGDAAQQSEIVSRGNRVVHRHRGKRGTEARRRVGMLGGHTRVIKNVDNGEVEAC